MPSPLVRESRAARPAYGVASACKREIADLRTALRTARFGLGKCEGAGDRFRTKAIVKAVPDPFASPGMIGAPVGKSPTAASLASPCLPGRFVYLAGIRRQVSPEKCRPGDEKTG